MTTGPTPRAPAPPPTPATVLALVAGLVLACSLIELALLGADLGLWGSRLWRPLAYQNGGFWAGLWHGWRPNYPAQPWAMLVTHAFLHAGPGHLVGNMLALAWLGTGLGRALGAARLAAIHAAGMVGGGAAFGLLATSPQPMVGASGAIFGLAAAWVLLWLGTIRDEGAGLPGLALRAAGAVALMVAANVAMWLWQDGRLAWEAHFGGFVAGGAMAAALGAGATGVRRRRSRAKIRS